MLAEIRTRSIVNVNRGPASKPAALFSGVLRAVTTTVHFLHAAVQRYYLIHYCTFCIHLCISVL
ncbi:unnamed protein product [Toxocara canis]|uniref:Uncharacterized protein n=1 Tax=Toxocara canis TaxID=6265 RepID=A0A183U7C9_TOXCA|nr:unnamed protein product [Toxocara canis]